MKLLSDPRLDAAINDLPTVELAHYYAELSEKKAISLSGDTLIDAPTWEEMQQLRKEQGDRVNKLFKSIYPELEKYSGGIARGECCLVVADSGVGKTHFAVSLSSEFIRNGSRILYVTLEDGLGGILDRLSILLDESVIKSHVSIIQPTDGSPFKADPDIILKNLPHWASQGFDVIVIDNLGMIEHTQKKNSNYWEAEALFTRALANVVRPLNTAVFLLHHHKKPTGRSDGPTMSDISGSSILARQFQHIWALHRDIPKGADVTQEIMNEASKVTILTVQKTRFTPFKGRSIGLKSLSSGRLVPMLGDFDFALSMMS